MSTVSKALKLILLFFLIFVIVSLLQNTIRLVEKGLVVRKEQQSLEKLREKNQQLRAQFDYVKTSDFLEQEARNSLGLTKDESVLILPADFLFREKAKKESNNQVTPWRQWWELFF